MNDVLSINIRVAGREYPIKTPPQEEFYLREAGRIINERIKTYYERGYTDDQDILVMVAIDSLVARQKGDESVKQLQEVIMERISMLDKTINPILSP